MIKTNSIKIMVAVSMAFLISCSEDVTKPITEEPCPTTITYAGKTYNTVEIGTQCWLKENLDVGTMITSNSRDDNQTDNGTIEKYCYNNDLDSCAKYGGLYQWNEAMQYETTEGTQGICPQGWHIPTYVELQTLKANVDSSSNALKAVGQGSVIGVGTNTSGFSALLSGYRAFLGSFSGVGKSIDIWSSTGNTADKSAKFMTISDNYDNVNFYIRKNNITLGYCIRCLKD